MSTEKKKKSVCIPCTASAISEGLNSLQTSERDTFYKGVYKWDHCAVSMNTSRDKASTGYRAVLGLLLSGNSFK